MWEEWELGLLGLTDTWEVALPFAGQEEASSSPLSPPFFLL